MTSDAHNQHETLDHLVDDFSRTGMSHRRFLQRAMAATRLRALWHVVVPLALPGMVVALVFSFLTGWNDILFASVLTNPNTRTLAYQLQVFSTAQEGGALPLYGQLMGRRPSARYQSWCCT